MRKSLERFFGSKFLFEELVKRDFKQKYKGTVLGVAWSALNPILTLFVMRLVFTEFFGRDRLYYSTYLFTGLLFFNYYAESTREGMGSLLNNSNILQKVNVPKYLFLLSKNVSVCTDFLVEMVVYFIFVALDGVPFTWHFLLLVYPIVCMTLMNIGVGLILSALYVYFRDTKYLYGVFITLLRYLSAIFYYVDSYQSNRKWIFRINPVYNVIDYARTLVLEARVPSWQLHVALAGTALFFLSLGTLIYRKKNHDFIYYL